MCDSTEVAREATSRTHRHLPWTQRINRFDEKVYIENSIDKLLNGAARDGAHSVLIQSIGHVCNPVFYVKLINEVAATGNFFIMGHLLHQAEGEYALHDQCLYVNLEIFRQLNHPNWELDSENALLGDVSSENVHDDYTPLSIKPRKDLRTQANFKQLPGSGLINASLNAGYTLNNFSNYFRREKFFLYPKNTSKYEQKAKLLKERELHWRNEQEGLS